MREAEADAEVVRYLSEAEAEAEWDDPLADPVEILTRPTLDSFPKEHLTALLERMMVGEVPIESTLNSILGETIRLDEIDSMFIDDSEPTHGDDVFKVYVQLNEAGSAAHADLLLRKGDDSCLPIAVRFNWTKDRDEFRKRSEIRYSSMVPVMGQYIDDFFIEEWIDGVSVAEAHASQPLEASEVQLITEAWLMVGKALSPLYSVRHFPTNMGPEKVMFRRPRDSARIVVVDIRGDGKSRPATILHELLLHYVRREDNPEALDKDKLKAVLEGLKNVMGFGGSLWLLLTAIRNPVGYLSEVEEDAIYNETAERYGLHGKVYAYVKAEILTLALRDGKAYLDLDDLRSYTLNLRILRDEVQMSWLFDFFKSLEPTDDVNRSWNEYFDLSRWDRNDLESQDIFEIVARHLRQAEDHT